MPDSVYVALGCAVGAWCRFETGRRLAALSQNFPVATLLVNVAGSFLMGVLAAWPLKAVLATPDMSLAVGEGFLGAFTTFSSFSMDTFRLYAEGRGGRAALSVVLHLALCLGGVFVGYSL